MWRISAAPEFPNVFVVAPKIFLLKNFCGPRKIRAKPRKPGSLGAAHSPTQAWAQKKIVSKSALFNFVCDNLQNVICLCFFTFLVTAAMCSPCASCTFVSHVCFRARLQLSNFIRKRKWCSRREWIKRWSCGKSTAIIMSYWTAFTSKTCPFCVLTLLLTGRK